jgi:GNAT superfamily N-acetyltransferase
VVSSDQYPSVSVREATPDDVAVLRGIYRRASLSNEGDRESLLGSPDHLEWAGESVASGRTRVATDERGQVLGFATVVPLDVGLELEDLFTDPEFMRRGVATQLVATWAQEAARAGAPWIEVTANPHAAAFYASAGFITVGRAQTTFGEAPRLRLTLEDVDTLDG